MRALTIRRVVVRHTGGRPLSGKDPVHVDLHNKRLKRGHALRHTEPRRHEGGHMAVKGTEQHLQ